MRFVFCAIAVCFILNDFSYIDIEGVCAFIKRCFNYDGGFGQQTRMESHGEKRESELTGISVFTGGSTFCAVASLALLDRLCDESVLSARQIEALKRFALLKQDQGFHGRTNKPDDTCYAFWIGATLSVRFVAQFSVMRERFWRLDAQFKSSSQF